MARQWIRGTVIYGPYFAQGQWRLVFVEPRGEGEKKARVSQLYPSEKEAIEDKQYWQKHWNEIEQLSFRSLIERFEYAKRSKKRTDEEVRRIMVMLGDFDVHVDPRALPPGVSTHICLPNRIDDHASKVTQAEARLRYVALQFVRPESNKGQPYAVDTHQGYLSSTRRFFGYLVREQLLSQNPFADVSPVGEKVAGNKEQLRQNEVVRFFDTTMDVATQETTRPNKEEMQQLHHQYTWDALAAYFQVSPTALVKWAKKVGVEISDVRIPAPGGVIRERSVNPEHMNPCWAFEGPNTVTRDAAIAALMTYCMGLRKGEITARKVRDIDCEGTVLVVERGKTKNSNKRLPIPVELQSLLCHLTEGRKLDDWLFANPKTGRPFTKNWLWANVKKLCRLAGVKEITPHGMRGSHGSNATINGASIEAVAQGLRHGSSRVTQRHYVQADALAFGQQNEAMRQIRMRSRHAVQFRRDQEETAERPVTSRSTTSTAPTPTSMQSGAADAKRKLGRFSLIEVD